MTKMGTRTVASLATALVLVLDGCTGADVGGRAPEDARAFFTGKTMTYIVATEPGGGYDTYGRLVSKYLGKHLGLNHVVVKNVAGGSHLLGTNQIYTARPDGLTLGTFNAGLIYAQLLRRDGLHADLKRMSWVGKAGDEPRFFTVSKRSGFRSFDDVRRAGRPLLLGANGVGNEGYYDTLLLARALGLQVKLVFGLPTRDAQLSMMRGEIDGEIGSASSHRQFVRNGYGHTVLRVGHGEDADAQIPDANDLVTTAEGKALVALVRAQSTLMRWTAGPPAIPDDRLAVLRDGYMAALRDPALIAEARKFDIPIVPMDGATLAKEVERALAQSPEALALIASAVGIPFQTAGR